MRLRSLLISAAALSLFAACNSNTECQYHFLTSEDIQTEDWTLFIDGQNYGRLTNPISDPDCDNPNEEFNNMIAVVLDSKKHKFEAVDANGTIRCSGYVKQDENTFSIGSQADGNPSGMTGRGGCACTLITLFD